MAYRMAMFVADERLGDAMTGHRPKSGCGAAGCDRLAWSKGLCLMHYKRERRGTPLADRPSGDPDGHGLYGVLDVDDDGVLCHECGNRFRARWVRISTQHMG